MTIIKLKEESHNSKELNTINGKPFQYNLFFDNNICIQRNLEKTLTRVRKIIRDPNIKRV
jgi:hypothetical protein